MKYYILLIYLLAFSLATEGNTAVKDSLSEALPSSLFSSAKTGNHD